MIAAVNGDVTSVDAYLTGDAADRRVAEIWAGLERLGADLVVSNDRDDEREFSSCPCDSCRTRLAGSRHRFAILGPSASGER
jgi:hypothetical protein